MTRCEVNRTLPTAARLGLLVARVLMAGLFLFSGAAKLGWLAPLGAVEFLQPIAHAGIDPAAFAGTIKGFRILHTDLIPFAAFAIPWTEIICGLALLVGIGSRGAARIIMGLLVIFCLAMLSVLVRKIDIDCTCFGKFLGGKVGWLSIARNVVLLAIMTPVAKWGGGMLALENLFVKVGGRADDAART